jgi:membrane protease YdiL (CAAX protease family)
MISKKTLFAVLWLMGMVGVVSTLWMTLPIPVEDLSLPLTVFKLINLITPTFLLSLAVLTGVNLAHRVGLSAPFAEAIASGSPPKFSALKPQIVPGIMGGVMGGVILSLWLPLWEASLPADFLAAGEALSGNTPLFIRMLYGGVTEEILLRWGLMTLLIWLAWRVFQNARGLPHRASVIGAIALSAIVFGLAHLPIVFALTTQANTSLLLYIVLGNALFGLIAGYLYWRNGLEAAIISHMFTHLVMSIIDRAQ